MAGHGPERVEHARVLEPSLDQVPLDHPVPGRRGRRRRLLACRPDLILTRDQGEDKRRRNSQAHTDPNQRIAVACRSPPNQIARPSSL